MPNLTVQGSDGEPFQVDADVAKFSKVIEHMESYDYDDDVIPLMEVKTSILKKVFDWAEFHHKNRDVEQNEAHVNGTDWINQWDNEFLNVDRSTLYDIMVAANYLDIPNLVKLTCKHMAKGIRGKTLEEVRTILGISDDFTEDEEAQIREENAFFKENCLK